MTKKFRVSVVQVMALLALFGILLGVVGTAFLYNIPQTAPTVNASGEVTR